MAEQATPGSAHSIRYNAQVNHPRNRISVREWQLLGRIISALHQRPLADLIALGIITTNPLEGMTAEDCRQLHRKVGLHMGVAMVEEYSEQFPDSAVAAHDRAAKVALGRDENWVSVGGRLMRCGNRFFIRDEYHLYNGHTCVLKKYTIGSTIGRVVMEATGEEIDVPLDCLHEVRF